MTATYPSAVSTAGPASAGRAPDSPVPRETLAGLDDQGLLAIARSPGAASESRAVAQELLVARHRRLVFACVQRYRGSPEPAEDLVQVGYIGLMKAISRYDPAAGSNLAAYAQVCISGEVKRYFRDKCWPVHVRRSAQDLVLHARQATSQLTQDLGRPPTHAEMARHLQVSGDDLRDAQRAELAFRPSSLDAPLSAASGSATLGDVLGVEDRGVEHMLGMHAVAAHWGELPPREQAILQMRFRDDMTQAQIGQHLGISQMHVSRLSSHALGHLRQRLLA